MKQPLDFAVAKLRTLSKTNNFFSFTAWYKVLLSYVTKFQSVLIFTDDRGQNISLGFLFPGAPKIYVLHTLIFAESPKMPKITKFYTRKNIVP